MSKTLNIRLDENQFTDLALGKIVVIERDSIKVQLILADFGYGRMLDILENALDNLSKTDGSKNWENRPILGGKKHLSGITNEEAIEAAKAEGLVNATIKIQTHQYITLIDDTYEFQIYFNGHLSIPKNNSLYDSRCIKAHQYLQSLNYGTNHNG